jgi:hypothetical protein
MTKPRSTQPRHTNTASRRTSTAPPLTLSLTSNDQVTTAPGGQRCRPPGSRRNPHRSGGRTGAAQ